MILFSDIWQWHPAAKNNAGNQKSELFVNIQVLYTSCCKQEQGPKHRRPQTELQNHQQTDISV